MQYQKLKESGRDIPFMYLACGTEDELCDANRAFAMPATVLRKENTEVVVMLIGPDGRIMNADVAEVKSKQEQSEKV